jgi:hypothetical protein
MRFESKVRKYHTRHRSHPHLARIGQVCGVCGNSIEAKTENDTRYLMSSRRERGQRRTNLPMSEPSQKNGKKA